MTSIKSFENSERQKLEKDVNKFLERYENCITSVNKVNSFRTHYDYLA